MQRTPATYLLVAINIAVFVWMAYRGVDPKLPSHDDLLRYGANNAALVLHGQWWRLLSAMFVHIGLLHLASNMWCMWNLGMLGEPLLGWFGMIAVYLLAGAAGNLLTLAWNVADVSLFVDYVFVRAGLHPPFFWAPGSSLQEVGAGASGAVFGIAGILIILLSNKRLAEERPGWPGIPWSELRMLRKNVVSFSSINLVIGIVTIFWGPVRIDNTAHMGGFLCGLAMGIPLLPRMTSGRAKYRARQKVTFAGYAFLLSLFGYWIAHLR